jgi:ABC-type multidrug transport system ATPase subunit
VRGIRDRGKTVFLTTHLMEEAELGFRILRIPVRAFGANDENQIARLRRG